jgi:hypothetical protein
MNALTSLGSSYFSPKNSGQITYADSAATSAFLSTTKAAPTLFNEDAVSLSDTAIEMSKRASALGSATVDAAQNFLTSFAQQLFGSNSAGLKISFDSSSISSSSQIYAAVEHSSGPDGSRDAASVGLKDVSDFVGKGQITTADGHRYNFEVEVHYQSIVESAAITSTTNSTNNNSDSSVSTATKSGAPQVEPLSAHFPGTINDLFGLLNNGKFNASFQLPVLDATKGHRHEGKLQFHLLGHVDSLQSNAKKLNDVYGVQNDTTQTAIA